ncbi:MAG: hypothetical protein U0270_46035, partial [Labilithrix sp.]
APPGRSNAGLLIAGVVVGAMFLLGIGGAAYFMTRRPAVVETVPSVTVQVGSPSATPTPEPAVSVSVSAAPVPTTPAPRPSTPPAVVKDAGPPAPSQDEKERALAKTMQPSCDHFRMRMTLAKTPEDRKREAEMARGHNCIMQPAIRCQRQICRDACFTLNDENCKRNVDDLDRSFPAKY